MTAQNALQVEKLLPQHPELDGVILLIGLNDLLLHLAVTHDAESSAEWARRRAEREPHADLRRAFSVFPVAKVGAPWYRRSGIERLWGTRVWRVPEWRGDRPFFNPGGTRVEKWRAYRKQASALRDELPDLTAALDGYERNVNRIIDAAAAEDARVLFMTQPTLWRENLTEEERGLLWMGGPPLDRLRNGAVYYSVGALAEGMKLYNRRLLEVCRKRAVECFDLASRLPRDTALFWDEAHFTVQGARRVAELVSGYLLDREPLAPLTLATP